jgi:hypothetical protein
MEVYAVGACVFIIAGIIAFIISLEEDGFMFFIISMIFISMGAACVILCVESKSEKIKQSINEATNIYINGDPVSDGFNLDGITLDRYYIRIDGDNVYLETK